MTLEQLKSSVRGFSSENIERGKKLFFQGACTLGTNKLGRIVGRVQEGDLFYNVVIFIDIKSGVMTDNTCSCVKKNHCEHIVALLCHFYSGKYAYDVTKADIDLLKPEKDLSEHARYVITAEDKKLMKIVERNINNYYNYYDDRFERDFKLNFIQYLNHMSMGGKIEAIKKILLSFSASRYYSSYWWMNPKLKSYIRDYIIKSAFSEDDIYYLFQSIFMDPKFLDIEKTRRKMIVNVFADSRYNKQVKNALLCLLNSISQEEGDTLLLDVLSDNDTFDFCPKEYVMRVLNIKNTKHSTISLIENGSFFIFLIEAAKEISNEALLMALEFYTRLNFHMYDSNLFFDSLSKLAADANIDKKRLHEIYRAQSTENERLEIETYCKIRPLMDENDVKFIFLKIEKDIESKQFMTAYEKMPQCESLRYTDFDFYKLSLLAGKIPLAYEVKVCNKVIKRAEKVLSLKNLNYDLVFCLWYLDKANSIACKGILLSAEMKRRFEEDPIIKRNVVSLAIKYGIAETFGIYKYGGK